MSDEPAPQPPPEVCLAVLNPKGRDPYVDYADGPGDYRPGIHPPVNYHSYAAATRGAFFDSTQAVLRERDRFSAVLVLIRRRVGISLEAIRKLKQEGMTVLAGWKECGPYQITEQLQSPRLLEDYQEVLSLADGILSPTQVPPPRWGWITAEEFARKMRFIPTPYPLEFESWDFSVSPDSREGIIAGTREFFAPTRNHLRTLSRLATLSDLLKAPVTVINGDKRQGMRILEPLVESFPEASLEVIERPLPYDDYLRLIARHRLVFQLDRSSVPGQVAGDALLCRTLCAGGNSALERVAFPTLADDGSGSLDRVYERIGKLFDEAETYRSEVEASQQIARDRLSYTAGARELANFLRSLS